MSNDNTTDAPSGLRDAACSAFKCFACSRIFTDTEKLAIHEQNEHPNEYHAAMVNEIYGYQDGYDFEPNATAQTPPDSGTKNHG